jgi:hypothetical protein
MDSRPHAPGTDQIARRPNRGVFRSASQRVNEVIEAVREPGMPAEQLSSWTRQALLQPLAVALLVGVIATRRRR